MLVCPGSHLPIKQNNKSSSMATHSLMRPKSYLRKRPHDLSFVSHDLFPSLKRKKQDYLSSLTILDFLLLELVNCPSQLAALIPSGKNSRKQARATPASHSFLFPSQLLTSNNPMVLVNPNLQIST
jgi:hypothetical protein